MSECRTCGAEIVWATSANTGKRMPLDLISLEKRVAVVGVEEDGSPVVRVVDTYVSHFATCPGADEWRRRED